MTTAHVSMAGLGPTPPGLYCKQPFPWQKWTQGKEENSGAGSWLPRKVGEAVPGYSGEEERESYSEVTRTRQAEKKRVPEAVLHPRRRLRREGGPGDPGLALRTQSCAPAASPPPKPFLGWARTHALRSRADAGGEHPVAEAAARPAAGSGSGAPPVAAGGRG